MASLFQCLRQRLCCFPLCLVLLSCWAAPVRSAPPPSAPALKAVFIFHFTQFVEWPETSFASSDDPFVIGVLGDDPFSALLEAAVLGELVHGHRIVVRRIQDTKSLGACHLVYVARGAERAFAGGAVTRRPILTVGESDEFLRNGGIIEFLTDNGRVRLRVDLSAARTSSLEVSSKLLRVSEVIGHPRT